MKTNAAAKKRFTFTGTGKIKRKHAYHSHILTKKTTKQKRNLCYSGTVSAVDEAKNQEPAGQVIDLRKLLTGANQPQRTRENRVADSSSKTLQVCHVQSTPLHHAHVEKKF